MHKPTNLIEAWMALNDANLAAAMRHLSERVGREYPHKRLYDWRSGKHTPPADVLRLMALDVAPSVLPQHGVTDARRQHAIVEALMPPVRV